ncbi:hypothetical protein H6P81_009049 [Aristolochia fimbriata]|uniref:Arabinogalactan peptide 22 n=1 Tax=Aristolochia fimbriata TaxID=158543 RepID=A0AAV7EK50_ARIFI|nr:hypothetical protein H6P81_009049 [Aristolochia fimbriata]
MDSMRIYGFLFICFFLLAILHLGNAQDMIAPSPAVSDSKTIDQGIAYVLLLVALAITYIFH